MGDLMFEQAVVVGTITPYRAFTNVTNRGCLSPVISCALFYRAHKHIYVLCTYLPGQASIPAGSTMRRVARAFLKVFYLFYDISSFESSFLYHSQFA